MNIKKSINKIMELIDLINKHIENKQKILIVFDIDETIISPKPSIGSDKWFRRCMKENPDDIDLLIDKMYYIYSMMDFKLVEQDTKKLINVLDNNLIDYFCLTARNPLFTSHTIKHLTDAGVNDTFVRNNILNVSDCLDIKLKNTVKDNFVSSYGIRYLDNICHSSGNHKGEIITHILENHYESTQECNYDVIIFIDDSDRNINKVYDSFLQDDCYKSSINYCIHYLFMEDYKNNYSDQEYMNDSKKLDSVLKLKKNINNINH